ncbi:oligosaccharide flippase family protein [Nitrospira lenta]|uniref:Uncharacterized protein n=1 Tax=Nitrospira lenta TaxID=1436998 RepID=A0A330L8F5_9BACT|nr:oligosaccharide flippase family protein [Nitrospira lenta]SPP65635.1 membrane hypothetical protein [Nitrospira lenta]
MAEALLGRLVSSTVWDAFERLSRGLNVLVGLLFIRYVGPTDFGSYSYLASMYAILAVLTNAGMDAILVRDRARANIQNDELFRAGLALKVGAFVIVWGLGIAATWVMRPALLGLAVLIGPMMLSSVWPYLHGVFRAVLNMRGISLALSINTATFAGIQLVAMSAGASLRMLVLLLALKEVLATAILLLAVHRKGVAPIGSFAWRDVQYLLQESWPILISGALCIVYTRVDQMLLMHWTTSEAVGTYAAAVRFIEYWNIIPSIVLGSLLSGLSRLVGEKERFERAARIVFRLLTVVIVPICVVTAWYSDAIVLVLFGERFQASGQVLALLTWSSLFIFWGTVNNTLLIVLGRQRLDIIFTSASFVVSIGLNVLLIPIFHERGAAVAAVACCATGSLIGFFVRQTRRWSFEMYRSLLLPAALSGCIILLVSMMPVLWYGQVGVFVVLYGMFYMACGIRWKLEEWDVLARALSSRGVLNAY